jgi:hypothetical protein
VGTSSATFREKWVKETQRLFRLWQDNRPASSMDIKATGKSDAQGAIVPATDWVGLPAKGTHPYNVRASFADAGEVSLLPRPSSAPVALSP